MNTEDDARNEKLAELEILRQSLEEKTQRIWELEKKVEILEGMLNRLGTVRGYFPNPLPQAYPARKPAPRRWSVR